ncbi:MAG TPA: DUF2937 family protein [Rhizobiaceae bacterium]|nr:DUF2937 family protein [Rhizobiaceae bacterium]
MGAIRQNLILVVALGGAVSASQLPEFAQQYRQRIGGAIEELGRVVAEFDRDAAANGLTREEALDRHAQSPEPLFRDRGESASASIERFQTLLRQQADFAAASPFWQPVVLADSDEATLAGTWRDFRPAVPVTIEGLGWAGAGFAIAALIAWFLGRFLRWGWRFASTHRPASS